LSPYRDSCSVGGSTPEKRHQHHSTSSASIHPSHGHTAMFHAAGLLDGRPSDPELPHGHSRSEHSLIGRSVGIERPFQHKEGHVTPTLHAAWHRDAQERAFWDMCGRAAKHRDYAILQRGCCILADDCMHSSAAGAVHGLPAASTCSVRIVNMLPGLVDTPICRLSPETRGPHHHHLLLRGGSVTQNHRSEAPFRILFTSVDPKLLKISQ